MEGARGIVLALTGLLLAFGCGCASRSAARAKPAQMIAPAGQPTWGPSAEGLQCRLRPTKAIWHAGEAPTFKADLRNGGSRIFSFMHASGVPTYGFRIDGRWHPPLGPPITQGKVWPLAPGAEFTALPVTLSQRIADALSPGRHVIQVVFTFEGVEVVSNPVEIDLLPSRALQTPS